jgi:hypothetical protein
MLLNINKVFFALQSEQHDFDQLLAGHLQLYEFSVKDRKVVPIKLRILSTQWINIFPAAHNPKRRLLNLKPKWILWRCK